MMQRLRRTTDGYFLHKEDGVYPLGDIAFDALPAAIASASETGEVTGEILAPTDPETIVIVGLNYPSHAAEFGMPTPDKPIMGVAQGNCVVPTKSEISRPESAPDFMDYEAEIAIIIGKSCENVSEEDAKDCILGLSPCIDLGLRDVQFKAIMAMRKGESEPKMTDAKVFPGSKPLGPDVLVLTASELDGLDLALTTHVNDKIKQTGNASEMMFSPARLVSEASAQTKLEPGDIICTGTPAGVGLAEGRFLEAGHKVVVTLGSLEPLSVTIA